MIKSIKMKGLVFSIWLSFSMAFFVLFLRKCLLHFVCCLLCYFFMQENVQTAIHRSFSKQVFLKISQYSQENTCFGVTGLKVFILIKKETPTQVFSCECWILLRTSFLQSACSLYFSEILCDDRYQMFQSYILLYNQATQQKELHNISLFQRFGRS